MSLKRSRDEICKFFRDCTQDSRTGRYSHSKVIACLGFFALTFFMWKLIIAGTMGIEFFICYAAYCAGSQGMNKFLDGRNERYKTEYENEYRPRYGQYNPHRPIKREDTGSAKTEDLEG